MVKIYTLDLKNKGRHGIFMVISVILEGCPPQKIVPMRMTVTHSREGTAYLVVYNVFNYWVEQQLKSLSSAKVY